MDNIEKETNVKFMQVADENGNFPSPNEGIITTSEGAEFITEADKQYAKEFYSSDDNKQKALYLGQQIAEAMRNKWFTVEAFAKKIELDFDVALLQINICKEFNNVNARMGDASDGPQKNGQQLFKIALNKEDHIKAIDDMIAYHQRQIDIHDLRKKTLIAGE